MVRQVYIAAPYPTLSAARHLAQAVAPAFTCCSRWLLEGFEELTAENAQKDLDDVRACDILLAYNPRGGRSAGPVAGTSS